MLTDDELEELQCGAPGGEGLARLDALAREDVLALLRRFGAVSLRSGGGEPWRRRLIAEKVFPALRAACVEHGIGQPYWLAGVSKAVDASTDAPILTDDDEDDSAEAECWVSGSNGVCYSARYCPKTGRLRVLDEAGAPAKLEGEAASPLLVKALLAKAKHFSKEEIAHLGLRFITVHPGGPGSEGQPVLVHDDGEHYTVVGGAGGKLNQMVLKKPEAHQKEDEQAAAQGQAGKQKEPAKPAKPKIDEQYRQELAEKRGIVQAAIKEQSQSLRKKVADILGEGAQVDRILPALEREAEARALSEHPEASEGEKEEFKQQARKEAAKQAKREVEQATHQVLNAALEHEALRSLEGDVEDEGAKPPQVRAKVAGRQIVRDLSNDQVKDLLSGNMALDDLKRVQRSIARALRTGNRKAVDGIEAALERGKPTEAEVHAWAEQGLLDRESVLAHTALVKESLKAGAQTQARYQASGAADSLNTFVSSQTGQAVVGAEVARQVGVENAARVAAAYLKAQGKGTEADADAIREKIVSEGAADAMGAVLQGAEADKLVESAREAAGEGDGAVTPAQVALLKANMARYKYRNANVARGQLRGAQALAQHLKNPSDAPMRIDGGATVVEAHKRARGLGLARGDYRVVKDGSRRYLDVNAASIAKLADPRAVADAERGRAMDGVRDFAAEHWRDYRVPGMNENVRWLGPHQVEAVEGVLRNKKLLIAQSAGSGKSSAIYGIAASLLSKDPEARGIITMPSKPRSQQNDYVDEGGERRQGECRKFLSPELAGQVVVVKDGAHLKRLLKKDEGRVLVMSPELVREHQGELLASKFAGERAFFLGDEAHQAAIGNKDRGGSGLARATREMARAAGHAGFFTGTPIENDVSEMYSLIDTLQPGSLGSRKQFVQEWQNLAQSGGLFHEDADARMRDRLSGVVSAYFADPKRKGADGGEEPVQLEKQVVTVKASPAQRRKIAAAQRQYKQEKASADPDVKRGASFALYARINHVLRGGSADPNAPDYNPKFDALARIVEAEKGRSGQNRVGVYSDNLQPLREAGKVLSQHGSVARVVGSNTDQETQAALDQVNDRTNDSAGMLISRAGNYGINAQGLDHIVKLHPIDTPAREEQVDHRHFRNGQDRDVRVTTILSDQPVEQMAQFRTTRIKKPELDLLARLAGGADDSGRSEALASNLELLERVASQSTPVKKKVAKGLRLVFKGAI